MKRLLIATAALLVIAGFFYFCTYTVQEQEWVIVTEFGKPVKTVKDAGLYVKAPWIIHTVNRFDRRTHLFEIPPIQLLLSDKNPMIVSCYVAWAIEDPLMYFQSVGNMDNASQKLRDMVGSQLAISLGDFPISAIINTNADDVQIEEIEQTILKNAAKSAREKYGVSLKKVGIQRLAYPKVVVEAVLNRMKSERNKEAAKLRAEGEEEAAIIRAEADKQAASILSEAEKAALIIRGEGERQAMELYGKAYSKDPEFFRFIRSLDAYNTILDKETVLILSTDSELLHYLEMDR